MAIHGRINETLFKLLEVNFIKHRKALSLNKEIKNNVMLAYTLSNKGSKLLYDCIENPNIEIPSIDSKNNPKMDKLVSHSDNKLLGH